MAEDARRLLDHLGIDRADVDGYSMGARIAAFLAIAHPDRVSSSYSAASGSTWCGAWPAPAPRPRVGSREHRPGDEPDRPHLPCFRRANKKRSQGARRLHPLVPRPDHGGGRRADCLSGPGRSRSDDVIGGSASALAELIPGRAVEIPGRDHMKAVGDRLTRRRCSIFCGGGRRPSQLIDRAA